MKVWKELLPLCLLLVYRGTGYTDAASHTTDNILDFFPASQGDGLNIIWAHGVNSHEELEESLNGDTMMLETDIILRGIGTPDQTDIPVNAHPPATDSDLLTRDFINHTTTTPGKGMKLDFKYLEALGPTMEIILELEEQVNCPLWINADIVKGPNSPRDPVDPIEFIGTANEYFSETVMSLGFTTDWGPTKTEDMYTWTMVFDILQYTYPLATQPVTYPIRAIWCVRSWPKFTWLLGLRETFSITVWSGSMDLVDVQGLVSLRAHGDTRRIFYDLPDSLRNSLLEGIQTGEPEPDEKPATVWSVSDWIGYHNGQGNFVFLSTDSAGISGPAHRAGFIQSVDEHEPGEGVSLVRVHGRTQFVNRYNEPSNNATLEVFLRADAIDGSDPTIYLEGYTPPSIRLQIGRDGLMKLGSYSGLDIACQLPPAECYSFELTDDNSGFLAQVTVATCSDAATFDPNEGRDCKIARAPEELVDVGEQSFVVITKRGGSGDLIVEDLAVVEEPVSDPGAAASMVASVLGSILAPIAVLFLK